MNQKSVTTNAIIDSAPNKILNGSSSSPIRLQKQAKKKLGGLQTRADKNRVGRKIRVDDLVGYSLELLNYEQLK